MVRKATFIAVIALLFFAKALYAQQAGSLRGSVLDKDFSLPLAGVQVTIVETGTNVLTTAEGNFIINEVPSGKYTVVFAKEEYARQVEANVVIAAGQMTELQVSLAGEFVEMEAFVVQDLQVSGTEAGLLMLRVASPALLDSISSELIGKAGAGDAASALKLVAGATVQDGKYAVIRGLPDRYVNSQMNGVRLPSSDENKRAVQLDQFPSAVIESVQVSKTFTPDQQGDASGGAVNVVLKSIPEENILKIKTGTSMNTQTPEKGQFLTYKGGGIDFRGKDRGGRDIPDADKFKGTVGVSEGDAPRNFDVSITAGGKQKVTSDVKVGGFANVYYKRGSSYYGNGINDKYWVDSPGEQLTPQIEQANAIPRTALYNVQKSTQEVQTGGLFAVGAEIENHSLEAMYMRTLVAEDAATLFEDTRGKEFFNQKLFNQEYNPNDSHNPGNATQEYAYVRTETLKYTERTSDTLQIKGKHKIAIPDVGGKAFAVLAPEIDWTVARSSSALNQPNKRQFGSVWDAPQYNAGFLPWVPPSVSDARHYPYKPSANFSLGNLQQVWMNISEDSRQYFTNVKLPFEQWSGDKGYMKVGLFRDKLDRKYVQQSFSNFDENNIEYFGGWNDLWSTHFYEEEHSVTPSMMDVNYKGKQDIDARYYMIDFPLCSFLKGIGGIRYESTSLSIINDPESGAKWVPPGTELMPNPDPLEMLPGVADVSFHQNNALPSLGFELKPFEKVSLRGAYSQTVARQTFKELSPIQQQEFQGSDVFIGNPGLKMSAVKNLDLRLDYTPYTGGLFSFSWFKKEIRNPIEYIQKGNIEYTYTTAVNYPSGLIRGFEIEMRQQLGQFWKPLNGFSLGANATFIHSLVRLPKSEIDQFNEVFINVPMAERDMLNAPEHLYNYFLTYNLERLQTELAVFYTIKGDTLVVGAGQNKGSFVPSVYAKEYGTLNMTLSKKFGKNAQVMLQAKNLTNPQIREVYRSRVTEDRIKTSYTKGIDYSLGVDLKW